MKGRYKSVDTRNVPGPGTYKLSDSIGSGQAPSYTLRPKTVLPADLADAPGPGAYNVDSSFGKAKLSASMKSRHYEKADGFQPGPGAYRPESYSSIGNHAPKISMHKKLGDYTFAASSKI